MLYYHRCENPKLPHVHVNKPKAKLLTGLLAVFPAGGLAGAWGYHSAGHYSALPVSAVLGAGSVGYDVKLRLELKLVQRLQKHAQGRR